MTSQANNIKGKHFLVKIYPSLLQIEEAIRRIVQYENLYLQLSILGKLFSNHSYQDDEFDKVMKDIKIRLNTALGKDIQFGYFNSPEIGVLFVAGHLTETFLHKIDGKKLASLTVGLLGIFKGLEIELENIDSYQKELQNGKFLLIIRGQDKSLASVENLL
jgi:hypothetical protein